MTKLIGKVLKKGDTIGVVAPASYIEIEQITKASENFKKLGYNLVFSENCYKNWNSFSGTDEERAEGINNFFRDPKIDAIICLRGGYGALRILDLIDYEIIKANPKIFIGFSDITSLHTAIFKMTKLITFHGPMLVSNFSDKNYSEATVESLFKLINNSRETYEITNPDINLNNEIIYSDSKCEITEYDSNNENINSEFKKDEFRVLNSGITSEKDEGIFIGEAVGGNLITFLSLVGSEYEIDLKDKILIIEEVGEYTYKIDRMISQLSKLNNFDLLKGIILCDFNSCDKDCDDAFSLEALFEDKFKELKIPIISNVKSGHCNPMVTLPIGANIEINTKLKSIRVKEKLVK